MNYTPGKCLGSGCTRIAYVCKEDPTKVIKVAMTGDNDREAIEENRREFNFWKRNTARRVRRWLARCYQISRDGRKLVMARTKPVSIRAMRRVNFPPFISDIHEDNIGRIGKRIVIHDYALGSHRTGSKRKRKH
jgi:hypothetical protein